VTSKRPNLVVLHAHVQATLVLRACVNGSLGETTTGRHGKTELCDLPESTKNLPTPSRSSAVTEEPNAVQLFIPITGVWHRPSSIATAGTARAAAATANPHRFIFKAIFCSQFEWSTRPQ
jgi:hypothetical protein